MLGLADHLPKRRRPSLTPMIDVVFLLLVFFMLAARFGVPQRLDVASALPGTSPWQGPPRLVTVTPGAALLNGAVVADLPAALAALMQAPGDAIVIRPGPQASVGDLTAVLAQLRAAGLTQLFVVE